MNFDENSSMWKRLSQPNFVTARVSYDFGDDSLPMGETKLWRNLPGVHERMFIKNSAGEEVPMRLVMLDIESQKTRLNENKVKEAVYAINLRFSRVVIQEETHAVEDW